MTTVPPNKLGPIALTDFYRDRRSMCDKRNHSEFMILVTERHKEKRKERSMKIAELSEILDNVRKRFDRNGLASISAIEDGMLIDRLERELSDLLGGRLDER